MKARDQNHLQKMSEPKKAGGLQKLGKARNWILLQGLVKEDFLGGSVGKVSAYNPGDPGSISLGQECPLEKEMATSSNTLACKIPWMEEPGRLQSLGSQRAGHD